MTSYQSSRDIIVIVMNDTHDFEGKRCATLKTADEANIKTCATAVILFCTRLQDLQLHNNAPTTNIVSDASQTV